MKKPIFILLFFTVSIFLSAQSPQKLSYQAVIRDATGKLIQNSPVGIKISVLQGSATGVSVYTEVHSVTTNVNGLVSLEIGGGITSDDFSEIDWASGPYFLKTETDPMGGSSYTITGTSQLLSVPYALYAGNGFSGDYNDLINKPITDGSETKVTAGTNIQVNGEGTIQNPYVISGLLNPTKVILAYSQSWTVPSGVSKIKVELWGGSGGGGGAGVYSYSYTLNDGGNGGSGGYAEKEMDVTPNQQLIFTIGNAGVAGENATYSGYWSGDTNGGNGENSLLYISSSIVMRAAGGTGGKKGSYTSYTVHGTPGNDNLGTITGYCNDPWSYILNVFNGLPRSYISDRILTSPPGKGGSIVWGYSSEIIPTPGEAGCAIISFLE
ncbi:MAG: hypothetical protein FJY10_02905 [Bacteroidetes bacterium]|nr:hypothetical protein [Bacteroidota bacterium]